MNTMEFQQIIGAANVKEPIVLENGFYDAKGGEIHADGGIIISAGNVTLCNATVYGCITVTGRGAVVQNCKIKSGSHAILLAATDAVIRQNEIDAPCAVIIEQYSENVLVAQNNTTGEIKIDGATNCSVVLNRANSISVEGSTSVSLSSNTVDKLTLANNDYLICDNNAANVIDAIGNDNTNGDNITDENARPEYGTNDAILPHTNKELFVSMTRKTTVADANYEERVGLIDYIRREAAENHVVIVPPGAYAVEGELTIGAECSNSKIYAYGVFMEKANAYGASYNIIDVQNLELHGLTTGYARQACGQVHIIDVIDNCTFLAVTAAGMVDDFGKSNPELFHTGYVNVFRCGHIEPYGSFGGNYTVEKLDDGILKFTIPEDHDKAGKLYKGDILTCRMALPFLRSIYFSNSKNVLVKDTVLYGYSSALGIVMGGDSSNVRMVRWHDTAKYAPAISEATFEKYRALEEKYGVSLEVNIDDKGRWRGAIPRLSTMDSTHISGSREGLTCISSIMENMCDDATNQRASSARLASLTDLGNGTTSLKYKNCATEVYFNIDKKPTARGSLCPPFKVGDHILVYASNGKTICNTHTLSATEKVGEVEFTITGPWHSKDYTSEIFEVIVPTEAVDFSAVEGYDLEDNHYRLDNKAFVDNLDRNSANYLFDNVMMRDARGRGILAKTVNIKVTNCTFRNLLHSTVMFSAEPTWGESTAPQDVIIEKCLFDHNGYTNEDYANRRYFPIAVYGQGSVLDPDAMLYKDYTIRNNKFINTYNEAFVYINAAQKVTIENNIFERAADSPFADSKLIVDANLALDVTFKGNTYPNDAPISERVTGQKYKNVIIEDECISSEE